MKYAILSDRLGQYISGLKFERNGQENVHGCNDFNSAIHYSLDEAAEVIAGLGKSYTAVSEDEAKAIARDTDKIMKPVNRFYTDKKGNRCEISAEELQAENARLNAKPEHQNFLKTGIRSGTDDEADGVVTIRSRSRRVLGKIKADTYQKLIGLVGVEEARAVICDEGQFSPDWEAYIVRLGTK